MSEQQAGSRRAKSFNRTFERQGFPACRAAEQLKPDSFPNNNPGKSITFLSPRKCGFFIALFVPPELLLSGIIPLGKRMNCASVAIGIIH
jgi:hypothetical protein